MKTQKLLFVLFASAFLQLSFAQDRTTVTATNNDISDNLNLKAVASIFGDAANLEDFERRLNDPKTQISNLDLNNDNQVDYLRVIESTEKSTHLIIIQAVLEKDIFQDVATIEVEKDSNNNVQVQVVGNTYMYGSNYIYEPVYIRTPIIYNYFWVNNYNPYYSSYYWGYYPSYYYAWNPYPIYRYRSNVNIYINNYNHYNYVNVRRSQHAVALYNVRRSNGYESQHPNRSFAVRNSNVKNRYELDQMRINSVPRTGVQASNPRVQSSAPRRTTDVGNNTYSSNTRSNAARRSEVSSNDVKYSSPRNASHQSTAPKTRISSNTQSGAVRQSVNSNSNVRTQSSAGTGSTRQELSTRTQSTQTPRAIASSTKTYTQNAPTRQSSNSTYSNVRSQPSNVSSSTRQSQSSTRVQQNSTPRSVAAPAQRQTVNETRTAPAQSQVRQNSSTRSSAAPNAQRSAQNARR